MKMFTTDQMVWIVQEEARVKSPPTKFKSEFVNIFNIAPRDASKLQYFKEL